MSLTLLDGPLGTELERRGLALPAPAWSARAVFERPDLLSAIHGDYAAAGADVHTAATFRTTARALRGTPWEGRWEEGVRRAVALCREAAQGGRVAGSIAPLEDCFSPELTPDDASLRREHAQLATALAQAGCDLLLVETMPTRRELLAATGAAAATGLPIWAAATLGPSGDFFTPEELATLAREAQSAGASAFLVNCTPADRITAVLAGPVATAGVPPGLALGAYGNALFAGEAAWPPGRYVAEARRWVAAGARIVGSCCGTGPDHTAALRAVFPR
ncbi:MAG: homocysteine S-methyltransferase family protein [Planctomycetes bacterium]|nr:homocysteine S-methyltransferase family protein [Planctomycetota bacterium]